MRFAAKPGDVYGLVHPFVDAHTLGVSSVAGVIEDCGYQAAIAGEDVCRAAETPQSPQAMALFESWLREHRITHLGFSYRLDPRSGEDAFDRLIQSLRKRGLLEESGGPVRGLFFAGLPAACDLVERRHGGRVGLFRGDESLLETAEILGLPSERLPHEMQDEAKYDDFRLDFGRSLVRRGAPDEVRPVGPCDYPGFGTRKDTLIARVRHYRERGLGPLMRAHVGPYQPDRVRAVEEFVSWSKRLAQSGYLDVLSIGTSQLTQSDFGADWSGRANGGGVPINSEAEYRMVYEASRPMLVRTYAGTRNVPHLARIHEEAINIAWHALSFWWFCKVDGRGPNPLRQNLEEHVETLRVIAVAGKPFEPNIPHHFAFRGADDVSYVVSSVLAARTAKRQGVPCLVLQAMLNTPRSTWGIADLAKVRTLLSLVRELEDDRFHVLFQPRAGLDYFSTDLEKARAQLAAVTALMDDVEPGNDASPDVIHVVSYSEASHLADPDVVDESVRITRAALENYRKLRRNGDAPDMQRHAAVLARTKELTANVRRTLAAIERAIPDPYSPEGLYRVFWAGFLPVPHLWECRDEFRHAVNWNTRVIQGAVRVTDEDGSPMPIEKRIGIAEANAAAYRETVKKPLAASSRR